MKPDMFFIIAGVLLCLLPLSVAGQGERTDLTIIEGGMSISCGIIVTPELIYTKENSNKEVAGISLSELKDNVLPVIKPENAKLKFNFKVQKNNCPISFTNSPKLFIHIKPNGPFPQQRQDELRLSGKDGRNSDYFQGSYTLDIEKTGEGQVEITFLTLEGKEFSKSGNKYSLRVIVRSVAELSAYNLSQNTTASKRTFVTENLKTYNYFGHFLEGGEYAKVAGYNEVKDLLSKTKEGINKLFAEMEQQARSQDGILDLYEVFGLTNVFGNSLTKTYFDKANKQMEQLEVDYVSRINATDILELEKELDIYKKTFTINKYKYRYGHKYTEKIEAFIDKWKASTGSPDYCSKWEKIQESDYYSQHKNDAIFKIAVDKCDNYSCSNIKKQSERIKSIDRLSTLLEKCKQNKCDAKICNSIAARIDVVACEEELERAKNEPDLIQQRSLLQTLAGSSKCPDIVQQAKNMLSGIETLKIDNAIGPERELNTSTGANIWSYTIYFSSGKNIALVKIDGQAVDSLSTEAYGLRWQWERKDREIKIIVPDREKNYNLIFRSNATGDIAPYQLTKQKFVANIKTLENLIVIDLENGSEPFYARFLEKSTKNSFTVKLDGSKADTLNMISLGENYQGKYLLSVLDNNGREGTNKAVEVILARGFQWSLHLLLLPPLLLLIGFMLYRNLPTNQR